MSSRARLGVGAALVTLALGANLSAPAASARPRPAGPSPSASPMSIVQLGDSVASGEGTLYGYHYDPGAQVWTGGNVNVTWPGPYPLCHDSPLAYGDAVAATMGARFSQFACTGAAFANGIETAEVDRGYLYNTTLRPAEFGNWDTQSELNAEYDAATPDVVLVTLGADDVQFVSIVEACIENAYKHRVFGRLAPLQCVKGNPGSTVTTDFTDFLPTLVSRYKTLVSWAGERGKADGKVPKVVFTDYYDPFPTGSTTCPDSNYLYSDQTQYLSSLLHQMDVTIKQTITGLHDPSLGFAELSDALSGHTWCTKDPWAYGLSIYDVYHPTSFESQAPFHPTPCGQLKIARLVTPVVERLVGTTEPRARKSAEPATASTPLCR